MNCITATRFSNAENQTPKSAAAVDGPSGRSRKITADFRKGPHGSARLARQQPGVPLGDWFKTFENFTISGNGELIKTLLSKQQTPNWGRTFLTGCQSQVM